MSCVDGLKRSIYEVWQRKRRKKTKKKNATKVILSTDEETDEAEDLVQEEDESGIYLEKGDMLVIYNALKNYKPATDDEEMTYEMLVEQFEETLVVDYKVKLRRSEG
jgi:hypothetical protein